MKLLDISFNSKGIFKKRVNKFLGLVDLVDPFQKNIFCHIHDPGRLEDLLVKDNNIILKYSPAPHRKTQWDLIACKNPNNKTWVLVNSFYHNKIALEFINKKFDIIEVQKEVKYKNSRIDFRIIQKNGVKCWFEIKGCTFSEKGYALFPDAPTKRGERHLKELLELKKEGQSVKLIILVFRLESKYFSPNYKIDKNFSKQFENLLKNDIEVLPLLLTTKIKRNKVEIFFKKILPIKLWQKNL